MRRRMFVGKIHRCVVTQADLDYEGSVTVDGRLLDAAGILEYEQVAIWNVTRGTRLWTYTMRAPEGSGVVCVNGAAAHLCRVGDVIIIAAFADMDEAEARRHRPRVVLCDERNRIVQIRGEVPGPARPPQASAWS